MIVPFLRIGDFSSQKCIDLIDELFEVSYFREGISDFSWGNSQKWINMAIKFYLIEKARLEKISFMESCNRYSNGYKLFAVDSVMIKTISRDFGTITSNGKINSPFETPAPWSYCNSKITFKAYWKFVEEKCAPVLPLIYETYNWQKNHNK